ncbi:MAG: hypothetical protein V9F06_01825 [Thermomicrobiales bacterium]
MIMLTATPYNKHYDDLASQLRLFVDPEAGHRHPAGGVSPGDR